MINPKKYRDNNSFQTTANRECLQEEYLKVSWQKSCEAVIDIGSGDGSFTTEVLFQYLPNLKQLVGVDKCEDMVRFSNEHYANDISKFKVLDIEEKLPVDFYGRFNRVFSFFTMHRIKNQEIAFSNIYDVLAPSGGCFLVILGYIPVYYETYRILSKYKKWSPWLRNIEISSLPYHDCKDQDKTVTTYMTKVGFTDVQVTCKQLSYTCKSMEAFKSAVEALNFLGLPEDLLSDFMEDFVKVALEKGYINSNCQFKYTLFVAHGQKK